MANVSLYVSVRRLGTDITRILAQIDVLQLDTSQRHLMTKLRNNMADARLDVRDYEFAETRAEQMQRAKAGRERLDQVRKGMLAASDYNFFSAIEVAELSARIDRIIDSLA